MVKNKCLPLRFLHRKCKTLILNPFAKLWRRPESHLLKELMSLEGEKIEKERLPEFSSKIDE